MPVDRWQRTGIRQPKSGSTQCLQWIRKPRQSGCTGSMHYERAALVEWGVPRKDVGQESEEKIGKSAEE